MQATKAGCRGLEIKICTDLACYVAMEKSTLLWKNKYKGRHFIYMLYIVSLTVCEDDDIIQFLHVAKMYVVVTNVLD